MKKINVSELEYKFYLTSEIPSHLFDSLTSSYNEVFEKDIDSGHFRNKYLNTILSNSFHCFLVYENKVVGNCSIIPFEYKYFDKIVRFGLAVDVFIIEKYRKDPFSLRKMYKILCKELIQKNISLVIAIPNDVAYPYWKRIVKWKDIGLLNYYVLPIKLGNVLVRNSFLNIPNYIFSFLLVKFSFFLSLFFRASEKKSKIELKQGENLKTFEKHRYSSNHCQITTKGNCSFRFITLLEGTVKTTYLLDYYNEKFEKNYLTLTKAVSHILKKENTDLIVFVGKIAFPQLLLFKLPRSKEPKKLYFTSDVLLPDIIDEKEINNIENWNFGLLNYDVR